MANNADVLPAVSGCCMNIGIVEDDADLLANLRFLLRAEPGFQFVHAFGSAEAFLETNPCPQLDILLVDLHLPGLSGIELIRQVKQRQPALNCLAFTTSSEFDVVFGAIKAGACGYLLKTGGFRELIGALHAVHGGGTPLSPCVARQLLHQFQQMDQARPVPEPETASERERQVMHGLAQGQTYKEIGTALAISPHTVNSHVKSIYHKLRAANRIEAIAKARQRGWL